MARVGGRNLWIAVPAGMLCLAVVGALGYLGAPMLPVAVAWAGDTLRAATSEPPPNPYADEQPTGATAVDCRDLFPNALWTQLNWYREGLLAQDASPPQTSVTTLVEALAPAVRLSCRWRYDGATIATTLSTVGVDAAAVADATLRADGFDCATTGELLRCSRQQGDVLEEHAVGGGLWLVSVASGWYPEDYGDQLVAHIWP